MAKRYQQAPKTIKDIEYLLWCLKKAEREYVCDEANKTLQAAMNAQGLILVMDDEASGENAHEYDSDEQMMLAVRCDVATGTFEVLGPAYDGGKLIDYAAEQAERQAEEAKAEADFQAAQAERAAWASQGEQATLLNLAIEVVQRCRAQGQRIGAAFENSDVRPVQRALVAMQQQRYLCDVSLLLAHVLDFDGPAGSRLVRALEHDFEQGKFGGSLSLDELRNLGDELGVRLKAMLKK